jgi:hypothetical protein
MFVLNESTAVNVVAMRCKSVACFAKNESANLRLRPNLNPAPAYLRVERYGVVHTGKATGASVLDYENLTYVPARPLVAPA